MVCIHCNGKTQVVNSRLQRRLNQTWRRRKCLACDALFTTEESVQYVTTWLVKSPGGTVSPFLRDKLFMSILMSLQHRKTAIPAATALTDTVIHKLRASAQSGALDSPDIARAIQVTLNRFDKAASVHYRAFHAK